MTCDFVLRCDSINSTHCYYFGTVYSIIAINIIEQAMNININGGMLLIITTLRGPLKTEKLPSCRIHTHILSNNHMCIHTHTHTHTHTHMHLCVRDSDILPILPCARILRHREKERRDDWQKFRSNKVSLVAITCVELMAH